VTDGARAAFSWRRGAIASVLVAAVTGAAIYLPWWFGERRHARELEAARPHPIPATDAQQAAILRALLLGIGNWGEMPPPPPPEPGAPPPEPTKGLPLLADRTATILQDTVIDGQSPPVMASPPGFSAPSGHWLATDLDYLGPIPRKLREEMVAANATASAQPDPALPGTRLAELDTWASFEANSSSEHKGMLRTTRAVLSVDGRQALLYADAVCDAMNCIEGSLFLFELRAGQWKIRRKANISGHSHLRCAPEGRMEDRMLVCNDPSPVGRPVDDAQQVAIAKAILDAEAFVLPMPPGHPEPQVAQRAWVIDRTATLRGCVRGVDEVAFCPTSDIAADDLRDDALYPGLSRAWRLELIDANQQASPLPKLDRSGVTWIRAALADRIATRAQWDALRARRPDVSGFLQLSRAVLSPDLNEALVYAEHHWPDAFEGPSRVVFRMREARGRWSVVSTQYAGTEARPFEPRR
jgi:hypothetical protein